MTHLPMAIRNVCYTVPVMYDQWTDQFLFRDSFSFQGQIYGSNVRIQKD